MCYMVKVTKGGGARIIPRVKSEIETKKSKRWVIENEKMKEGNKR